MYTQEFKSKFNELIAKCDNTKYIFANTAPSNVMGAKRVVTQDFIYLSNILKNPKFDTVLREVYNKYNEFEDLTDNAKAFASYNKLFSRFPTSYVENLELSKNPLAISIGLKLDTPNAFNTINEIMDYLNNLESCIIYFRDYLSTLNPIQVEDAALLNASEVIYLFFKDETEKVIEVITGIIKNIPTTEIIESAAIDDFALITEGYQILNEGVIGDIFDTVIGLIHMLFEKIGNIARKLGILSEKSDEKNEKARKTIDKDRNEKIFTNTKLFPKLSVDGGLKLTYYDKDGSTCINLMNYIGDFFDEVPPILKLANIDEFEKDPDKFKLPDLKDDADKLLNSLGSGINKYDGKIWDKIKADLSSDDTLREFYNKDFTNEQLLQFLTRFNKTILPKFERLSEKSKIYAERVKANSGSVTKLLNDYTKKKEEEAKKEAQKEKIEKETGNSEPKKNPQTTETDSSKDDTSTDFDSAVKSEKNKSAEEIEKDSKAEEVKKNEEPKKEDSTTDKKEENSNTTTSENNEDEKKSSKSVENQIQDILKDLEKRMTNFTQIISLLGTIIHTTCKELYIYFDRFEATKENYKAKFKTEESDKSDDKSSDDKDKKDEKDTKKDDKDNKNKYEDLGIGL